MEERLWEWEPREEGPERRAVAGGVERQGECVGKSSLLCLFARGRVCVCVQGKEMEDGGEAFGKRT